MIEITQFDGPAPAGLRDSDPGARFECKICWYVYEPVTGDDVWQIPQGTPFSELPAYWRCPECDSESTQFLMIQD